MKYLEENTYIKGYKIKYLLKDKYKLIIITTIIKGIYIYIYIYIYI